MIPSTQLFLNREIGLLKFNKRVLFQARDERNPLLERLRFLNIFQSNMDEFFMKRVGGLQRQFYARLSTVSPDGLTPEDQLKLIRPQVLALNEDIRQLLIGELLPLLKQNGVSTLSWSDLNDSERDWARQFFRDRIFSVLTPMAVDPGHPFPLISNLSTSLAVSLQVPNEEDLLFARIKIPDLFPAWVRIPNTDPGVERFISILEIVRHHLDQLFPRMQVVNVMPFRVTRNADIESDNEGVEDLLELIEEEVKQRKFAEVVRLEHGPNPDPWLLDFLMDELDLTPEDIYEYPVPLEYKNLGAIVNLNMPQLKFKPWTPVTMGQLNDESANIFGVIRSSDLIVHLPYESFSTSVERFIVTAASDPAVVAIKMTLYRTNEESPIVNALIRAAEMGKQVVCLVELKARFDEERNIYWAQAMEKAGVHVVYGIVGLKTHAKLALVVRRERDEFRSYVHIGTGNYHSHTARLYTDFGLFTAKSEITSEVVEIFHYLTGRSLKTDYSQLLVAPINMKSRFIEMIRQEADNAKAGLPSGIIAKCNSLEEKGVIEALYEASQAGVPIQLIVRGFSCLRPGVPGLSENIRVTSIVGQFLEHSRVFYFRSGKSNELEGRFFFGSADWMARNLLGRVEVVTPVDDKMGREKIWEALQTMLSDRRQTWDMDGDGAYKLRMPADAGEEVPAQELLAEKARQKSLLFKPVDLKN
ncbi:MAG: polyphosphate kinase 1 [Bdellovibrionales bacterium]|nr:polyphosphate kinase 1 [Bdellovibrionales bacterium]